MPENDYMPEDMTPVEMEDGIHYYNPITEEEDPNLFTPWSGFEEGDDEAEDENETEEPEGLSEEHKDSENEGPEKERSEEPDEPSGEPGSEPEGIGEGAAEGAGEAAAEGSEAAGALGAEVEAGELGAELASGGGTVASGGFLYWAIIILLIILGICLLMYLVGIIFYAASPKDSFGGAGASGSFACRDMKSPDPSSSKGFVKLPKSKNYQGGGTDRNWGTPEMVAILEGVLSEWNKRHPDAKVYVGDISYKNGGPMSPHVSHEKGVDVDLSSSVCPSFTVSDGCYKKELATELAKMLFDSKAIKLILYNDTSVQSAVNKHAKDNDLPGHMQSWPGHANHFHVRIQDGLYSKACKK